MRYQSIRIVVIIIILLTTGALCRAQETGKGRRELLPFDYRGVTLEDGTLKRQFDETRDFYLRIPNDDLLKGFRKRAGLSAPGADLTGWYGSDTFHIFGQILSGLARMVAATGDTACRDKANALTHAWEYTEYWNRYAAGQDIFSAGSNRQNPGAYHAYSHVNTLGGNGAAYLVTGDKRYLATLEKAYDYLQTKECFATGGYGPDEQLLPHGLLLAHLQETHNSFETQCGSWAAFKMAKYLISFTGRADSGDWVERLVINGIGASIPMSADGRVFYYSDYNPAGAFKTNCGDGWTCCAGTRPMAIADYHDLIYFHSPDTTRLYINLYTPSTLRWEWNHQAATLRQQTGFPATDTTEFTLTLAHPTSGTLALRVPGWLNHPMEVSVNGIGVRTVLEHGWASVTRTWKTGDHLLVRLPMSFHTAPLDPPNIYPSALLYGPVVLAARATPHEIAGKLDLSQTDERLEQSLISSPGEPLTWHLANAPQVLIRSFADFKEGEPYLLTIDPRAANRIPHRAITFHGNWNQGGQFRFSNIVGVSAEYRFEGTGIRWLGYRFDDAGRAEVRIDGKVVATVDQYGPGRDLPFDWKIEGLAPGTHTILITLLPEKSPESKDRFLNVAGFEIL